MPRKQPPSKAKPLFEPPPIWAPTAFDRRGRYPAGWVLKDGFGGRFSPTGCFGITIALFVLGALAYSLWNAIAH